MRYRTFVLLLSLSSACGNGSSGNPDGADRPDDVPSIETSAETSADRQGDVDSESCPNDIRCVWGGPDTNGVIKCPGDTTSPGICENGKRRCPAGTVEPHTCQCIGPPGPDGGLFCPGDAGTAG